MSRALGLSICLALVGAQKCSLDKDCSALAQCSNGGCVCMSGYFMDPTTSTCGPRQWSDSATVASAQPMTQQRPPVQQAPQQQQAVAAQQQQQFAAQLVAQQQQGGASPFSASQLYQPAGGAPQASPAQSAQMSPFQQPGIQLQQSPAYPQFQQYQPQQQLQQPQLPYSAQQQMQQQAQQIQQLSAEIAKLTAVQAPTTAPPTKRKSIKKTATGVCTALGAPCNDRNPLTFGDICSFPFTGVKELADNRAMYRSAPVMDDLDFAYPQLNGFANASTRSSVSRSTSSDVATFKSGDQTPVPPRLTCQGFVVPHIACLTEEGRPKVEGTPCVRAPNTARGDSPQVSQTCTFVQSGTQKSLQCIGTVVDSACMPNGSPLALGARCYPDDPLWDAKCIFDNANNAIRCSGTEVSPDCVVNNVPLAEGAPCKSSDSFPNGILVDTTCRLFQDEDMNYPYMACIGVFVTSECVAPGTKQVLPAGSPCRSTAPGVLRGTCQLDGSVVRCVGIQAVGSCLGPGLKALDPGTECVRSGFAGVGVCVIDTQTTSAFGANSLVLKCGDDPCIGARCPADQKCVPVPGPECSPQNCPSVHCERIPPTSQPTAAPTKVPCLATSCETCTTGGCKWSASTQKCSASCTGNDCLSTPSSCGGCEAPTCLACVRQDCQWSRGMCTAQCTNPPCLSNTRDCPLPCASMNDCASCTKSQCSWQGNTCKERCSTLLSLTCTTSPTNCVDPCLALKGLCAKGSECQVGKDGFASCVCIKKCAISVRPVCGSDGVTYDSQCDLDMVNCNENSDIKVVSQGRCPTCDPKACKNGAVCNGGLKCECVNTCGNEQSPMCGSDGVTYANMCRLKLATCISEGFITLLRSGVCATAPSPTPRPATPYTPYASSFATAPSSLAGSSTPSDFSGGSMPSGFSPSGNTGSVPSGFSSPGSMPSGFSQPGSVPSGFSSPGAGGTGSMPSGFSSAPGSTGSVPSGFSTGTSSSSSAAPPTAAAGGSGSTAGSAGGLPGLGQTCQTGFTAGQCAKGFVCVVDSLVNGQPRGSCRTDPNA